MKKIFSLVVATPIFALFVGIGVLAFRIGDHWDERNTDVLVSNVTMICGIGGLILALVFASFVGLVFYTRWQRLQHLEERLLLYRMRHRGLVTFCEFFLAAYKQLKPVPKYFKSGSAALYRLS